MRLVVEADRITDAQRCGLRQLDRLEPDEAARELAGLVRGESLEDLHALEQVRRDEVHRDDLAVRLGRRDERVVDDCVRVAFPETAHEDEVVLHGDARHALQNSRGARRWIRGHLGLRHGVRDRGGRFAILVLCRDVSAGARDDGHLLAVSNGAQHGIELYRVAGDDLDALTSLRGIPIESEPHRVRARRKLDVEVSVDSRRDGLGRTYDLDAGAADKVAAARVADEAGQRALGVLCERQGGENGQPGEQKTEASECKFPNHKFP